MDLHPQAWGLCVRILDFGAKKASSKKYSGG